MKSALLLLSLVGLALALPVPHADSHDLEFDMVDEECLEDTVYAPAYVEPSDNIITDAYIGQNDDCEDEELPETIEEEDFEVEVEPAYDYGHDEIRHEDDYEDPCSPEPETPAPVEATEPPTEPPTTLEPKGCVDEDAEENYDNEPAEEEEDYYTNDIYDDHLVDPLYHGEQRAIVNNDLILVNGEEPAPLVEEECEEEE